MVVYAPYGGRHAVGDTLFVNREPLKLSDIKTLEVEGYKNIGIIADTCNENAATPRQNKLVRQQFEKHGVKGGSKRKKNKEDPVRSQI